MKIGELVQRTGVAASAIRFYEKQGLLGAATRAANGYRIYDEHTVQRLNILRMVQKLGFSLEMIRSVILQDGACSKSRTVAQINIRLDEIDQLQATLAAQRAELLSLREVLEESIRNGIDLSCTPTASEPMRSGRTAPQKPAQPLAVSH